VTGIPRARRVMLIVASVLGAVAFALVADDGARAAASYLGGLAAASVIFHVSVSAVRRASDASPSFGVVVAMTSYLTVVVLMAAVASVLSPQVVDGGACAVGLVVAALLGLAAQYQAVRPGAAN
jgi:hypothetical protein